MAEVSEKVGGLLVAGNADDRELLAIRAAWDKSSGAGRDEDEARRLAREYVEAHPDKFGDVEEMTVEELCAAVDAFRAAGFDTQVALLEAWLLAKVAPQRIGGALNMPTDVPIKDL